MSYTTKDVNNIINDIILNIVENVDDVTDANVGSVMREFIDSVSTEIEDLYTQLEAVYDGTRIDTSTGDDLEQLGALVGITRTAGAKALADVSFVRTTLAGSDFLISEGVIVSTQPNTGETQLRFTVSADTTFLSSIDDESHTYADGVNDYALDERLIGNSSAMVITGTASTSAVTFSNTSDYNVYNVNDFIEDISTLTTLDECETADFIESDDAQACTTSTDKKKGTYSLNLGKNGTATVNATYSKTLGAVVNGSGKDLVLWLYLEDQDTIDDIDNIYAWLGIGGTVTNSYRLFLDGSDLEVGWKAYRLETSSLATQTNGTPSLSATNFLKIQIVTNEASDTITLGDVKMDYWRFVTASDYEGDIVRWIGTNPDDTTAFLADYKPLSKEVECVSEEVGADYNVSKGKIIYKVSSIANVNSVYNYAVMSGGSDEETDDSLRTRILYATELQGKATAESIRQAILGVTGVSSATVDDLPEKSVTSEVHLYSSTSDTYQLSHEVLSLDDVSNPTNIDVVGTVSSSSGYTFLFGTDYISVSDSVGAITSQIEWQVAGASPDDNTLFYVDYTYDWLGHVNVFVSGVETPMPTSVSTAVDTAISGSKAAGIVVSWDEPTSVSVNITGTLTLETDYDFTTVEALVETALRDYVNTLGAGEDVFISVLYKTIQGVTGVENSSITVPASDTTITTSQIAKIGTITLTEV